MVLYTACVSYRSVSTSKCDSACCRCYTTLQTYMHSVYIAEDQGCAGVCIGSVAASSS